MSWLRKSGCRLQAKCPNSTRTLVFSQDHVRGGYSAQPWPSSLSWGPSVPICCSLECFGSWSVVENKAIPALLQAVKMESWASDPLTSLPGTALSWQSGSIHLSVAVQTDSWVYLKGDPAPWPFLEKNTSSEGGSHLEHSLRLWQCLSMSCFPLKPFCSIRKEEEWDSDVSGDANAIWCV